MNNLEYNNSLTGSGKTTQNLLKAKNLIESKSNKVIYVCQTKKEITEYRKSFIDLGMDYEDIGVATKEEWNIEKPIVFTTIPEYFYGQKVHFIFEEEPLFRKFFMLKLSDTTFAGDLSFFRNSFMVGNDLTIAEYLAQKDDSFRYSKYGMACKLLLTGFYNLKKKSAKEFILSLDVEALVKASASITISSGSLDHNNVDRFSIKKDTDHYFFSLQTKRDKDNITEYLSLVSNKLKELKVKTVLVIKNDKQELPFWFKSSFTVETRNTFIKGVNTLGSFEAVVDIANRYLPNKDLYEALRFETPWRLSYETYKQCQQNYARVARTPGAKRIIFSYDAGTAFALKEFNEARDNTGEYKVIPLTDLTGEIDCEYYYDRYEYDLLKMKSDEEKRVDRSEGRKLRAGGHILLPPPGVSVHDKSYDFEQIREFFKNGKTLQFIKKTCCPELKISELKKMLGLQGGRKKLHTTKEIILATIDRYKVSKKEAAKILGISYSTLKERLKKDTK